MEDDDGEKVAVLRSLVSPLLTPYYDTHFNILRWIQAHPSLPVDQVAIKLTQHLQFRRSTWDLDSVNSSEKRSHPIHSLWPASRCGVSEAHPNHIVHVEQSGMIDFDGILANYSISEVMKARIVDIEAMLAEVMKIEKETGKQTSVLFVMDAQGVEYTKKLFDLVLGSLRSLSEFMADNYVELIKYFVIVNVPPWAYTLWRMVKPLLPERTQHKISCLSIHSSFLVHVRILSSNWREEILEFGPPEVFPSFWNDEKHNHFKVNLERPPKANTIERKPAPDNLEKVYVKAGTVHWMTFDVEEGDVISYYISSNANFGMAIVRADHDDGDILQLPQVHPLFPWMPGPTQVAIHDQVTVPSTGRYKMWLSNSRAWWSTLTLLIRVQIKKQQ